MGRSANNHIRRAFEEYQDDSSPTKCARVRCRYCGFVRAKNTTRQLEHLENCQPFKDSGESMVDRAEDGRSQNGRRSSVPGDDAAAAVDGANPLPNTSVGASSTRPAHPPPAANAGDKRGRDGNRVPWVAPTNPVRVIGVEPPDRSSPRVVPAPHWAPARPVPNTPSLTGHLLNVCQDAFMLAKQSPFLSHAGCGTLSSVPLSRWLVQDHHYACGYIRFVSALLTKTRPPTMMSSNHFHPTFRVMDLLISALNQMRREMTFLSITASKYRLELADEPPSSVTRAWLDLFANASSPSASLLEGMVVLWISEHIYREAWKYASTFASPIPPPHDPSGSSHALALHETLIPNWTSPALHRFVEGTRRLVDELGNSCPAANGREEAMRCQEAFSQVCWIAARWWPIVDGMGEQADHLPVAPLMEPVGLREERLGPGPLGMPPGQRTAMTSSSAVPPSPFGPAEPPMAMNSSMPMSSARPGHTSAGPGPSTAPQAPNGTRPSSQAGVGAGVGGRQRSEDAELGPNNPVSIHSDEDSEDGDEGGGRQARNSSGSPESVAS